MPDFSNDVAIVWPSDYPKSRLAHCTMLYLGEVSNIGLSQSDVQSILDEHNLQDPMSVEVIGTELFGEDNDVPVALLRSYTLRVQKKIIELALDEYGVSSASEYAFKPHVTLDPEYLSQNPTALIKMDQPSHIELTAPVLWWGDDQGF